VVVPSPCNNIVSRCVALYVSHLLAEWNQQHRSITGFRVCIPEAFSIVCVATNVEPLPRPAPANLWTARSWGEELVRNLNVQDKHERNHRGIKGQHPQVSSASVWKSAPRGAPLSGGSDMLSGFWEVDLFRCSESVPSGRG
jgi:hypothetical protein